MLEPEDVPKPNNVFWVGGPGYVKVVQPEPRREVLFSGDAACLWELVDAEEHSVSALIARMAAIGIGEPRTVTLLDHFLALQLISTRNHLWSEEGETP